MRWIVLLIFTFLLAAAGFTQAMLPTYRLGPDDKINILVQGHTELSGDVLLPADGVIDMPLAGRIAANGMTLSELTTAITTGLRASLRDPQVHINLKEQRMQRVFILGDVAKPGVYDLKPDWRITEALAIAGAQFTAPTDSRVTLVRKEERKVFEIPAVLRNEPGANPVLQPGDVLTVERIELLPVYVTGAVKAPGMYQLRTGGGAVEALALAGGLTEQVTDVTAVIMRGNAEAATIDLDATLVKHDAKANIPLQRGDLLIVKSPELVTVYVMGIVGKPGLYEIRTGCGVVEAITQAGGFALPERDLHLAVIRGEKTITAGSVADALSVKEPLMSGDIVKVESLYNLPVTVSGRVKNPGAYSVKTGDCLLDALAAAGGTLENAATSRLTLVHRDGSTVRANITASVQQGEMPQNLPLTTGDLIIVPEVVAHVAVLGYVNSPGVFPLPDGRTLRVTDALGLARGMENQRGGIRKVAVLRMVDGKEQRIICDLQKYFTRADIANNPVLQDDDIVYVPETTKPNWDVIFRAITALSITFREVVN